MTPILASDFGNLGAYIIGIPVLVIALLVGIIGAIIRVQLIQLVASIACLLISWFLYSSISALSAADVDDRNLTVKVAEISAALGLVILAISFLRKKKRHAHVS